MWSELDISTWELVAAPAELVGQQYETRDGRSVRVIGTDPLFPADHYLVEDENGKRWGVSIESLKGILGITKDLQQRRIPAP